MAVGSWHCPLCGRMVDTARFRRFERACVDCDNARRQQNVRSRYTESRRNYLRGLSVPELRAYVDGQHQARMYDDDLELLAELEMIADRLEWVATSLITAGIDGWHATYGGLRGQRPPRPTPTGLKGA